LATSSGRNLRATKRWRDILGLVDEPKAFGLDVDFAQLVKLFGDYGQLRLFTLSCLMSDRWAFIESKWKRCLSEKE